MLQTQSNFGWISIELDTNLPPPTLALRSITFLLTRTTRLGLTLTMTRMRTSSTTTLSTIKISVNFVFEDSEMFDVPDTSGNRKQDWTCEGVVYLWPLNPMSVRIQQQFLTTACGFFNCNKAPSSYLKKISSAGLPAVVSGTLLLGTTRMRS